jgi:hypothetical protein
LWQAIFLHSCELILSSWSNAGLFFRSVYNPKTCFRSQNQSQKKRRELSILIDTKLPQAPMPKMLFPPCVVVDFFFDEEERRYAITRRQRKEHKKGEKLARASQNSPYSNPLCPFFPSSFHSFIFCQREERYKNARFVSLKQKESKRWRKELPPFHPLSSIDLSSIEVYRW